MALESGGIYRWLWRVWASPGGFGEWGHLQDRWLRKVGASPGAPESRGISRWLWRVRASPGALESGGITMGFGE